MEGPSLGAAAEAAERAPEGRGGRAARPSRGGEGAEVPAAQEPRGPHRGPGLGARGAQAHGLRAVEGLPAQGGAAGGLPGGAGRGGRRAGRLARVGVPQPHTALRGALPQGPQEAPGHTQVDRAGRLQREGRGGEQQDQGGHQAGLRVPQHRQPDRAHHAKVLRPEAGPAGARGVASAHANSRSLRKDAGYSGY